MAQSDEVTRLVLALSQGDRDAVRRLFEILYRNLTEIATRHLVHEPSDISLSPAALVHEAFLRLVDQSQAHFKNRAHFLVVASQAMRRVLVDHARRRYSQKRNRRAQQPLDVNHQRIALNLTSLDDVILVDTLIEDLRALDERHARLVEMRFFGGLTLEEAAEVEETSVRSLERDWTMIRAWLRQRLAETEPPAEESKGP
jgi:RNA polymerase sigma factor (TIGR02999 family)